MGILKDRFLVNIIILGFLIRIIFISLPGFKIDVDAWFGWSERLVSLPFSQFYSDRIWTNYTPGYLYILYILGLVKNLFTISGGFYYVILKLPSIIAEIILASFVYKKIFIRDPKWAKIAALAIILNPAFIFNSAVWGQIDGLLTLVMVLSIYFLDQRNLVLSSLFLGFSFLIKPQTIALLPVYVFDLLRNLSVQNIFKTTFFTFLTIFILALPFFSTEPFLGIYTLFSKMTGDYSFTSLFAYNFWGGVGFWIPDNFSWFSIPYQIWGYIFYIIFWFWVFIFGRKKLSVYSLAALATLTFYFLPTRAHDRYLYPALIFLILVVSQMRSYILLALTAILSFIHLLNLYYVYVYYNEFYFKMPKLLYNPFLYNFLDNFGGQISVFSTVIFVVVSVIIIRYSHVSKKN